MTWHGALHAAGYVALMISMLVAFISLYPGLIRRASTDGSIFTSSVGAVHWQDFYASRVSTAAVERAGLSAGTTTRDLRHHFASVLLAAGESVVAVAERLGHENAALVLSTYGHLMPDSEDRTRRAVDEGWCAIPVPSVLPATRSAARTRPG